MDIDIYPLTRLEQLQDMQELERRVWGTDPIPVHQTWTAVKNGGVAIGAFDGPRMIGFVYGFPGFRAGEAYLCSHMMGVLPDYRNQGVGERLKHRQAEAARALGYRRMVWTYDPLEARNAWLNLSKLGAVADTYVENCYGELNDDLNRGMPSDRFEVTWDLAPDIPVVPEDVRRACAQAPVNTAERLLAARVRPDGLPEPAAVPDEALHERLQTDGNADEGRSRMRTAGGSGVLLRWISIPARMQEIRRTDPALALAWRMQTRRVFSVALAAGWAAIHIRPGMDGRVCDYALVPRGMLNMPTFKVRTLGLI
ncbi:GNAT family N-acetyltransferase [Alicyclobacillus macrosporangiidus]|uniref:Predicted acetyltransferase, GNAT superfamily n=1 Tax=Alicyclobacillus macrosporangiidus TaxID=392015 RepID=A0A1I7L0P5_9BACL|nr:GNAT family N-acetyltransferase [Alicyclobacillus macrosporangiidus]SFV03114.1 Predicted acetyltransferase, GNAT superfamily [Alicyclobacillus macrosporangiidus]